MSNLCASKSTWSCLNTKEDLFQMFNESVDTNVIEMVIESRNNNLLLAHRDLIEIAKTKDTEQNQVYPSNKKEKKSAAAAAIATNLKKLNFIDWEHLSKKESSTNKILYLVSNGYKVMVIMRGLPGSGKSFQATNILNKCYINPNSDEFIFSADKFFINKHTGRYHFNSSKLNDAHHWSQEKVKQAIQHEVTPIIVDNTNTQAWEMEIYFKFAVINGYWIEIIEPISSWAWEGKELSKRNVHSVSYDHIMLMMHRYEHNIDVDNLLTRFKLKYNKKNEPPQLSKLFKRNQLCENLIKQEVNKSSYEINEHFKDLCVSSKLNNCDEKNDLCISFKYKDEYGDTCVIQENKLSVFDQLENSVEDFPFNNDDTQSVSFIDEASNYVNKSVNTCENEFAFLEFLNNPEEDLYCTNYIKYITGKSKDINEENKNILNMPIGKLDKGTTTDDLLGNVHKPTLDRLREEFPENICLLLTELFDKCNGDINWISDMLKESGYDYISKQRLHNLIQFEKDDFTKNIEVRDNIEQLKQNYGQIEQDLNITSLNLQSNTVTFTDDKCIQETENKKKKRKKKKDFKENKLLTTNHNFNSDLRKNIENKFTFDDSLYSEHVLKIKQLKENQNMLGKNDDTPSISENVDEDIPEQNDEEKFVQLAIDTSVIAQLCDYFGDVSSDLNKSKLPISVKIPEKLAEELYYCLIANVPSGIFDQETILLDEIFARRLQEAYETPKPYSGQITFAEAVRTKTNKTQEIQENHIDGVQNDLKPNTNYNQEALAHAQSRRKYTNKANQSIRTKQHAALTKYYLDKAEKSKHNENQAKANGMLDIIKQNEKASILDLHFLSVQDAILALDLYLDYHISLLKCANKAHIKNKKLTIITGRGKHSPGGRPCIKPVVDQKVKARRLLYFNQDKEGLMTVVINKNSLSSQNIKY